MGAISISIDDAELFKLQLLIENNVNDLKFVENVIWKKRSTPPNDKILGAQHEYALVYCKQSQSECLSLRKRTDSQLARYRNPDKHTKGPWAPGDLMANVKGGRFVESLHFAIVNPNTGEKHYPGSDGNWRFSNETILKLISDNEIYFGEDGKGRPKLKRFLCDVKEGVTWTSLWDFAPLNTQGSSEMIEIFGRMTAFENPKPVGYIEDIIRLSSEINSQVLDYFGGSGTTGHAVINLNRLGEGSRKFTLIEIADYFDSVLLPRLKKVTFSPEWKNGKPKRLSTAEEAERSPRVFKIIRLESYEDTLNNLALKRTDQQQNILDAAESQGVGNLREEYLLRYLLNVETRESQSLLNVAAFADPLAYRLKVKRPGSDESREVCVDLIETFHWLIGLTVQSIHAPQVFSAEFKRDSEQRLVLKGRLKQDAQGAYWFRVVTGTLRDDRKVLIVWRKLSDDPEKDNLVLEEWFTKQGYSSKDREFDLIYVNGGNNLENIKTPTDTWKVRLIEDDFQRLMFATEGN